MEPENNEPKPSILNRGVGNIARESKQLSPALITIVGVREQTVKANGDLHEVPLIKFICKHPEKPETIELSKIKLISDKKVIMKTTWAPTDEEGNIQMGSAIDDVLKFFDVSFLAEIEGKECHTIVESKDSAFLCLKLFD